MFQESRRFQLSHRRTVPSFGIAIATDSAGVHEEFFNRTCGPFPRCCIEMDRAEECRAPAGEEEVVVGLSPSELSPRFSHRFRVITAPERHSPPVSRTP
jgi:hypothetical protein